MPSRSLAESPSLAWLAALVTAAGCGRVGYDRLDDDDIPITAVDAAVDATTVDASTPPAGDGAAPTSPSVRWVRSIDGAVSLFALDVDGSGRVTAAGTFHGTTDFGRGERTSEGCDRGLGNCTSWDRDGFVVAYDSAGTHLWDLRFAGAGVSAIHGAATASDGSLRVVGTFSDELVVGPQSLESASASEADAFAASIGSDGQIGWLVPIAGPGWDHIGRPLIAGDVLYIAGSFEATAAIGPHLLASVGGRDTFVAALGPDGSVLWAHRYGGPRGESAQGIVATSDGLIVWGEHAGEADFGTGPLDPEEGAFLLSLAPDGTVRGARRMPAGVRDVVAVPDDSIYVGGAFSGAIDLGGGPIAAAGGFYDGFVARYSREHRLVWSWIWAGVELDQVRALALAGGARLYVVGATTTALRAGEATLAEGSGTDAIVARTTLEGEVEWAARLDGDCSAGGCGAAGLSSDYGDLVATNGEHVVVGGSYRGSLHLGDVSLGPTTSAQFIALLRGAPE